MAGIGPEGVSGVGQACQLRIGEDVVLSTFEDNVKHNPQLSRVFYQGDTIQTWMNNTATKLVADLLSALGYKGSLSDNLRAFQELAGITPNGQLIGQKTLQTLIVAARAYEAGKSWKAAIAGRELRAEIISISGSDRKQAKQALEMIKTKKYGVMDPPSTMAQLIYDTRSGKQIPGRGQSFDATMFTEVLTVAYKALGVLKEGESLAVANYRFQILSGANEAASGKSQVGPNTFKKLKAALEAVAQGRDWRADSTLQVINAYDCK